MREIAELQLKVDALDSAIADLVVDRAVLVEEIRQRKEAAGMPAIDETREAQVVANLEANLTPLASSGEAARELAGVLLRRGLQ